MADKTHTVHKTKTTKSSESVLSEAQPEARSTEPHKQKQPLRGRLLTKTALGLLAVLVVAPMVSFWVSGNFEHVVRQVVYLVTTLLLLWQVWRGNVWAWRVTVALSILTGLLIFMGGMLVGAQAWQGWLFSLIGLFFVAAGLLLVGHEDVRAFLDVRWDERHQKRHQNSEKDIP